MAVQTPSYWKEEKYQPLVEVETLYGNKVKIPKRFEELWAMYLRQKDIMISDLKEGVQHGYLAETSNPHKKWAVDLQKVFYELYGKNDPAELMLREDLLPNEIRKD